MIDSEDWSNFISGFFNVNRAWILHVAKNWNHVKGESGCGCLFIWNQGIWYCNGWSDILKAREAYSKQYATGGQTIIKGEVQNGKEVS